MTPQHSRRFTRKAENYKKVYEEIDRKAEFQEIERLAKKCSSHRDTGRTHGRFLTAVEADLNLKRTNVACTCYLCRTADKCKRKLTDYIHEDTCLRHKSRYTVVPESVSKLNDNVLSIRRYS